jgi:hypothetical protein
VRAELEAEQEAFGVADIDTMRGVAHEGGVTPVLSAMQ